MTEKMKKDKELRAIWSFSDLMFEKRSVRYSKTEKEKSRAHKKRFFERAKSSEKYFKGVKAGFNDSIADFRDLDESEQQEILEAIKKEDEDFYGYVVSKLTPELEIIERGYILSKAEFRILKNAVHGIVEVDIREKVEIMLDEFEFGD